jgi:histone-lysine N-methyltransferase SETMAR
MFHKGELQTDIILFTPYGVYMRNRPENWKQEDCFLRRDKATLHSVSSTREFPVKRKVFVIPYPTFLPDLVPCDFFLFPEINTALKGKRFYNSIYSYVTMVY